MNEFLTDLNQFIENSNTDYFLIEFTLDNFDIFNTFQFEDPLNFAEITEHNIEKIIFIDLSENDMQITKLEFTKSQITKTIEIASPEMNNKNLSFVNNYTAYDSYTRNEEHNNKKLFEIITSEKEIIEQDPIIDNHKMAIRITPINSKV